MALSAQRKTQLLKFGGRSVARLIRFVAKTSEKMGEPVEPALLPGYVHQHGPCIVACWHGQFMMISSFHSPENPTVAMVARHGDAALIGHAVEDFGLELIRGAGAGGRQKDRGGVHALRAALSALEDGKTVVMTADVPPGPARTAGEGIVKLSMMSGRPIVPVAAATSRYHAFKTWSRMTLNLPFSKLALVAGPHIFVPADSTDAVLEEARAYVETSLNEVTARAYQLVGADPARATPPVSVSASGVPVSEPGFKLKAYRVITRAMEPVAPLILRSRASKGKEDPARRNERLGSPEIERPAGPLAWFHAASVGETNAVLPVIERLSALRPDLNFLLTTGTVTSATVAERRSLPRTLHQYAPLDGPNLVAKFLDHWRPDLAVFTESDVWPNLVLACSARGVPLALINARMSNRSFRRWRKNRGLARALFGRFDVVLAQDANLARRFQKIGARVVEPVGNLKIDAPPPPIDTAALNDLVAALNGRPFYVAASTHEGEEDIIGEAQRILSRCYDGFITLLAPRHPERGTAIAENLKGAGFSVLQRSSGHLPTPGCDIYIADTLGELGTLYAAASVAFVGGSLVDKGGQNPIEPIALGAMVLSGPHRQNFRTTFDTLQRYDAIVDVTDAHDIADAVARMLGDPAGMETMRQRAAAALSIMSGALDRTVATLLGLLPEEAPEHKEGHVRAS